MAARALIAARQAATAGRISTQKSLVQPYSLLHRRGLAGAADHHGHPKVNFWKDPMNPSKWKEEHFVMISLTGWGLLFYRGCKLFTKGETNKEQKLAEAAQ